MLTNDVFFHGRYTLPSGFEVRCGVRVNRASPFCFNGTFAAVDTTAAARGGRLCTATELVMACGRESGCLHDLNMIWSSTIDPWCDETNPCVGVPTPSPTRLPTVTSPPPTATTSCSAYRVVDGNGGGNMAGSALNGNAGAVMRHELTCCSDEAPSDTSNWRVCGGTPTTNGSVWGGRKGSLFEAAKVALAFAPWYDPDTVYTGLGNANEDGGAFLWDSDGCVSNAEWVSESFSS